MRFFKTLLCLAVLMPFIGCKNNENQEITLTSDKECVVVGNIKGLKNGRIELEDEFDGYQVIAGRQGRKDGAGQVFLPGTGNHFCGRRL